MKKAHMDVIGRLARWAEEQAPIRALLLTSSQARPGAALDRLSDYDVITVVTDLRSFVRDETWLRWYGPPLLVFRASGISRGMRTQTLLVLYEDGAKIDYTLWPTELLGALRGQSRLPDELDAGYSVLVDKDALTTDLVPPTYTAYIPRKPTQREYLALVEEFWWETTYVAKNLWRDELYFAKYNMEVVIRSDVLRRMLEWYVETQHGWSVKPGVWGRGFKNLLPHGVWARVEDTFAGADRDENWAALFKAGDLFRAIASEVADDLGYTYPHDLDRRIVDYLYGIKALEK